MEDEMFITFFNADDAKCGAGDFWREFLKKWREFYCNMFLTNGDITPFEAIEERMPDWVEEVLSGLILEGLQSCARGQEIPNDFPYWADAVVAVYAGEVDNLQEISWKLATRRWSELETTILLTCFSHHKELEIAVLKCIIIEAKVDIYDPPPEKERLVEFCKARLEYLQRHGDFDLAAIRQTYGGLLGAVESKLASIATQMPTELCSEDAQAILKRAVDAGLCELTANGGYKWLKSAELLGYFIYKMFDKGLSFRKGENISWIGWQNFFGTDDETIKAARQKVNNFTSHMGKYPYGYLSVDNVVNK